VTVILARDIAINYFDAETVASSQLGGKVCLWVRLDPMLIEKVVTVVDNAVDNTTSTTLCDGSESMRNSATGTTLAIRPNIPPAADY